MRKNDQDMMYLFARLASFGQGSDGAMDRLSWTAPFLKAQGFLKGYMESLGLATQIDGFGNLTGTLPGTDPSLPPVVSGSHLDTVPKGGAFDGALGICAALECARRWKAEGFAPRRPFTCIAFAEEEGTMFSGNACMGSRALTGELSDKDPASFVTAGGQSLTELLSAAHLEGPPFPAKCAFPEGSRFVELHIEQGCRLEEDRVPLGIVSAIVGIRRRTLAFEGEANHGGTTAMEKRRDALYAAAQVITFLQKAALASEREFVATCGRISAWPNAENVIAGRAELSVEIRAEKMDTLDRVSDELLQKCRKIEAETGVTISSGPAADLLPTVMDEEAIVLFKKEADALSVPWEVLPSWAGHDSMVMGRHMPVAMLFVPSIGGISHNKKELSSWEDIFPAVDVLDQALRQMCSRA